MDRIMLGRSLILHIKCFYIGSVIPIRREPSFLLSMWLTGCCDPQRTQILSKKSLLKKKKLQLKKMMNRNCQQWRRSETCLGCFFLQWLCLVYVVVCKHRSACGYFQHILFPSQGIILFLTMAMLRFLINVTMKSFPNKPWYLVHLGTMFAGGASSAWCCNCQGWGFTSSLEPFVRCSWWSIPWIINFFA